MKLNSTVVSAVAASALCLTIQSSEALAAPTFSDQAEERIDVAASAQVESGKTVGLAIEVLQDGKVVYRKGFGTANIEWKTPVTPDTVFRIASNTKTFTAVSILLLVQQGALSLDDKLEKFFPEFPRSDEVTIRQLLTHTSGITSYDDVYRDKPELTITRTMPEMIEFITQLDPLYRFDPGSAYNYSNSGYYLLGGIVEKVSGQSLEAFMKQNIFDKAGMTNTAMDEIEDIVPKRAAGYMRDPEHPLGFRNAQFIPYTTPGPAGGLRSTVDDLAKWHSALFGGKLINSALLAEMTEGGRLKDGRPSYAVVYGYENPPSPPPYEYGFGIRKSRLQGHLEYWHSGAVDGFTSQIRTYPDDKITIVLLANTFRALDGVLEEVEKAVLGLSDAQQP